jgi:hypothetical protein
MSTILERLKLQDKEVWPQGHGMTSLLIFTKIYVLVQNLLGATRRQHGVIL